MRLFFAALVSFAMLCGSVSADVIITEVHSTGSASSTYGADWFELTNTGPASVNTTGWRIDDNSNAFANSAELLGISSIGVGQSVIFIEGDATTADAFRAAWFGTSVPANFQIGTYSGSGLGFSGNGDAVNVFDAAGAPIWSVSFGAGTVGTSFDNAAGASGVISTLSQAGVNGGFLSVTGGEIGSPGTIAVPEPSSLVVVAASGIALLLKRRRQNNG